MTSSVHPAAAELLGVTKRYGDRAAVDEVSLTVQEGEFFSILGPSGCGKTTTLRILGGFVRPDAGEIRLGGTPVNRVPPHRRDVNTVFQSYALFSHLSVADNVAFGLRRRRVPAAQVRQRVAEMLRIVSLADRGGARPAELSGGQQQRVALARALVNMPRLLLLDEPLGALDLKLRRQMQLELKHIQREVGIAFVYVTHDQEEALTMSDRIAVMDDGRVLQVGTPAEIYTAPQSLFVARFIGSTNALAGTGDGSGAVALDCGAAVPAPAAGEVSAGERVTACVRPEKVVLAGEASSADGPALHGVITESVYLGSGITYRVTVGETMIEAFAADDSSAGAPLPVGSRVAVRWRAEDCVLFDGGGGLIGRSGDRPAAATSPTGLGL